MEELSGDLIFTIDKKILLFSILGLVWMVLLGIISFIISILYGILKFICGIDMILGLNNYLENTKKYTIEKIFEIIFVSIFMLCITLISFIFNIEYIRPLFLENTLFCLNLIIFCITILLYIIFNEEMIWKRKKEYLYSIIIITSFYFIYYQFTKDIKNQEFPIESLFNTLVAFLAITFLLEKINQIKTVNKRERLFWRYNHIYIRFVQINKLYMEMWNNIYNYIDGTEYKNEIIEIKKEVEFILSTFYSDIDNDEFNLIMQIRVNLDLIINQFKTETIITRYEYSYIEHIVGETKIKLIELNKKWFNYQLSIKKINTKVSESSSMDNSENLDQFLQLGINNTSIEEHIFRNNINNPNNSNTDIEDEVIYRLMVSEMLDPDDFKINRRQN